MHEGRCQDDEGVGGQRKAETYERAQTLLRTAAGSQKTLEDAQAGCVAAGAGVEVGALKLARRKASSPVAGAVQQVYYRPGEMVPAGKPMVALLPPGNIKVRFFVPEGVLPQDRLWQSVTVRCDGCSGDLTAKVSFISRTAEFTPPVIYSLEERSKLVFLVEARTDTPATRVRRRAAGQGSPVMWRFAGGAKWRRPDIAIDVGLTKSFDGRVVVRTCRCRSGAA